MKESINCKYSASCFTCPLEDCRIETKKAPFYNRIECDIGDRINQQYIIALKQKGKIK